MARGINRLFTLTKYIALDLSRSVGVGTTSPTTGKYIPASRTTVTIDANIQPMKFAQTLMMESGQRTKEWVVMWSTSEIKKAQEGTGGWEADTFVWNNKTYKVMAVESFRMGVLDHYHAKAALDSPTPREA